MAFRKKGATKPRKTNRRVGKIQKLKRQAPSPTAFIPAKPKGLLLLIGGSLLAAAGVLSFPNFQFQIPGGFLPNLLFLKWLALVGFVLLAAAFRLLPEPATPGEISKNWASVLFMFLFGLTFYTRFCHPETPEATFWYDDLVVTGDVRGILDLGNHPLLFPWGQREPFFPYLNAILWLLMPKADGVFINRLSSTLVDMGTCWGLYLLGRTVSGRRTGLFLMSFYAVSKPFMVYCYFGYGANTCELSTVWMMVFLFRLLNKPSFRRFVYLGIALGFGAYTYVPARLWTPYLIGILWLWILYEFRQKGKDVPTWTLLIGVMGSWAFLFLSKNNVLSPSYIWVSFLNRTPVALTAGGIILAAYIKTGMAMKKDPLRRAAFGWSTLAVIAFLFCSPFLFHPLYASHVSDTSVLNANGKLATLSEALKLVGNNIYFFFAMMFGQSSWDTGTYPTWVGSFFDYFPELAMIVGLAFFAAKPGWKKLLTLSMLALGTLPFILSNHAHSARALAVVGPLFLMAGWGMDYSWRLFTRATADPRLRQGVLLVLGALWVWSAYWSNWQVWNQWMAHKSNDATIFQQIEKDWRSHHLIIAPHYPQFESPALTMLCDQKEVWALEDPNPLYLEKGETAKDIVLLFWGYDQNLENRLKADFPSAPVTVVPNWNPDRAQFLKRVQIPFNALSEKPGKLFYIVRVPHDYWRRRFYWQDYGVGHGLVWWDDRVRALNAPFPAKLNVWMSGKADGEFQAPVEGNYTFASVSPSDWIGLAVDGKEIIRFIPGDGRLTPPRATLHLTAGAHRITYTTYFQHGPQFPRITILPPVGPERPLGE